MRVIIVGSGIVGASCAYTASSRGAEVLLADAALPGQATAAGAGIVCPWSSSLADDPVWYDFASASARYYPGLIAELANHGEVDLGYRRVGGLILTGSPEQQETVAQQLQARRAGAPEIGDVAALSAAEARRSSRAARRLRRGPRCRRVPGGRPAARELAGQGGDVRGSGPDVEPG